MERRFVPTAKVQLRADAEGKPTITGYAAVYYNASDPGTEFAIPMSWGPPILERLMPGCFDRAAREDDVRALFNHDASLILGRTGPGTLKLSVDATGLRYDIDPPDTACARDLMESLKRGDVSGSSFSFDYLDKTFREVKGPDGEQQDILEVRDVRLFDVGPVAFPAYASTSAGMRSASQDKALAEERERWKYAQRRNSAAKRAVARMIDL